MRKTKSIKKKVDLGGQFVTFTADPWSEDQKQDVPMPEVYMSLSPRGILIDRSDVRRLIKALESVERSLIPS